MPIDSPARDANIERNASVGLWIGWSLIGLFVCCGIFTAFLFIRYPLLEDTSAGNNKLWPMDTLKPLAIVEAVLATAGGIIVGVSKGILKFKLKDNAK